MSCNDCPDMIIETIAYNVRRTMYRVQRIQRLTTLFSRLLEDVAETILALIARRLDELYALIPEPPVADIAFYLSLIRCPLTPLALAMDPSLVALLDPREVLKRYKACARQYLCRAENYYDMTLADAEANDPRPLVSILDQDYESLYPSDASINSGLTASAWSSLHTQVEQGQGASRQLTAPGPTGPVTTTLESPRERMGNRSTSNNVPIRIARKYVREVVIALEDPIGFAAEFASTAAAVAQVRATCPLIFYSTRWPFRYWADTVAGFDFDQTTCLPGIVKGGVRDLSYRFMRIEAKLFRWQAFIAAPI